MKLKTQLAVYDDVREVADPWGNGIIFKILRHGSADHQDWLQKNRKPNKVEAQVAKQWALKVLSRKEGESKDVTVEEIENDRAGIIIDLLNKDELNFEEVLSGGSESRADRKAEALHLLRGWHEPIEIPGDRTYEFPGDAEALLSIPHGVLEEPFSGQSLGDALVTFIRTAARANDDYRRKVLEADEKNSEASPGTT